MRTAAFEHRARLVAALGVLRIVQAIARHRRSAAAVVLVELVERR